MFIDILSCLFIPSTDFSTSLGPFSQNYYQIVTHGRHVLKILSYRDVYICLLKNLRGRKPHFHRFEDLKSTLSAKPFHNAREMYICR